MTSLRTSLPGLSAFTSPEHPLAGRYVIEREIGSGGMAFVVLANDLRHNRRVAIKVLRGELSSTVNADRFLREIEIAAGLTHPHILPVHDSGAEEGLLFYVMPYVEGETLAARVAREGALSLDETMRLTRQIASALEYAHGQAIVHRDIKPENVLLPGGVAVVADFGLARALERDSGAMRITDIGMGIGTPTYLSPEQALGSNDVDARSDQYSLACVVYEMLAGQPPFDGKTIQAMFAQHISKPAPRISTVKSGIPASIESALARALMKAPDERFGSIREFVDALDQAAADVATGIRKLVTPARVVIAALVVAVAFAAGTLLRTVRGSIGRVELDDNVIAVAPFDVLGQSLSLWREGLMDVLARSLDGAGPLRTVSPTLVVRSWKGRADKTSAGELGRANRAGLAVFGQVITSGADSVRATVTLYDVRGDSALSGDMEIRDVASRMDRVADSIGVRLLRALSRTRRITAAPVGSLGSHALPALKAFLRGEQLYRRSDFVGARSAYEEALAADSNFALAYHRMRNVLRPLWLNSRLTEDSMLALGHHAGELNHGMSLRDSLMILADSLLPGPHIASFIDPAEYQRSERRFAALERAAALYPHDAEVWAELAEARLRVSRRGSDPEATLVAYERAIATDSLFGPAYPNAIRLALMLRGRDSALVLARRFLKINNTDRVVAAVTRIVESDRSDKQLQAIVRSLSLADARDAAFALAPWPDPQETAIRALRLLTAEPGPDAPYAFLGAALRFRGHLDESLRVSDLGYRHAEAGASELLVNARSSIAESHVLDSLSIIWVTQERRRVWPIVIAHFGDLRDTTRLTQLVERADAHAKAGGASVDVLQWRYLSDLAQAYKDLIRGDSAAAEQRFRALPDSLAWELNSTSAVLDAARLFDARGRAAEASALLARHPPSRLGVSGWRPFWYLEFARARALSGDVPAARLNMDYAVAAWSHADSVYARTLDAYQRDLRRRGVK
ncbi:MAG TPA: serine/threonine-protein kinase [Gemmatimonadaceae bacterium]|nr:serine/threonine-protein kinase [Gemmatimonadaceae bacterium]